MASASEAEALRQRWKELDEQRVACEGRLKGLQNPLANGLQYRPSEDVDRAKEGDGAEAGDGAPRAGPRPGFARRGPPDGPSPPRQKSSSWPSLTSAAGRSSAATA